MPRTPSPFILLVLLVLLPAQLLAQRPGAGGAGAGGAAALEMLQRNPIQIVIDARGELGLSDAQIGKLVPVRDRLLEDNRENLARIKAMVDAMPRSESGNREAMQAMMERIRPLRQEVQENNRAALQEIRPHLTNEQWSRASELVQPRRQPGQRES